MRKIPRADGTTPLMVAAGLAMWYVGEDGGSLPGQEDEALEAVKMCVALGNDVNAANELGETPLHGAAFRGVNAIVEFLVEKGAKLDARDSRGWTPFTIANGISYGDVYKQQPQTAELLEKLMTGAWPVDRGPGRRRHRVPRLRPDARRPGAGGARARSEDGSRVREI